MKESRTHGFEYLSIQLSASIWKWDQFRSSYQDWRNRKASIICWWSLFNCWPIIFCSNLRIRWFLWKRSRHHSSTRYIFPYIVRFYPIFVATEALADGLNAEVCEGVVDYKMRNGKASITRSGENSKVVRLQQPKEMFHIDSLANQNVPYYDPYKVVYYSLKT